MLKRGEISTQYQKIKPFLNLNFRAKLDFLTISCIAHIWTMTKYVNAVKATIYNF